MASFTPNYNLDLYDSTDKPNLRDQYNGAMNKLDTLLETQQQNINTAMTNANQALENSTAQGEKITDLQTNMSTAQDNIETLQTGLSTANGNITQLQTDVAGKAPTNHASPDTTYGAATSTNYGHVRVVDDLSNAGDSDVPSATAILNSVSSRKRAKYKGCTVLTIGDSIMLGTGTTTPETQGMHAQIGNMLDATVHNYAENNAGYTTTGTGTRKANFITQLQAAYSDYPNADVVIISGGCNDATVTNNVETAAYNAISYAVENFENAEVFVAPFQYGACQGNDTIAHGNNGNNNGIIESITRATLRAGATLINHCWETLIGQTSLIADGGVHPNADGAAIQAAKVVAGMLGYDYRPSYNTNATGGTNVNINEFTCKCVDGMVILTGTAKSTAQINAFGGSVINLPAYANRASSRLNGGMLGDTWSFCALYQNGTAINTATTIPAESEIYHNSITFPLGY